MKRTPLGPRKKPLNRGSGIKKRRAPLNRAPREPEWLPHAAELHEAGRSYAAVALEVGVHRSTVYYWLTRRHKHANQICVHCDERFTAAKVQRYCSRRCNTAANPPDYEAQRERMRARTGRKNPNFKHGKSRRDPLFSRKLAAKFNLTLKGEDCCRACGSHKELHLHHAIPRSMCRATRTALLNGIPLCIRCHLGWHHRRVTIYRDNFTAEEWAFISTVELQGQNLAAWLDERYPDRNRPFCNPESRVTYGPGWPD